MNDKLIIEKTKKFVKSKLGGEASGHDWWHSYRVYNNAVQLAHKEKKANMLIVELGALLHDISDWKFNNGDHLAGGNIAKDWLESLKVNKEIIDAVVEIMRDISFRGANESSPMKTIEGKIVQDADRLDALGAIGIGRTFSYGGVVGREMYNPNIKPVKHKNFEQYKKSNGPTLNHFYEKLLLLKDRMNTAAGKKMAKKRHLFMERFLAEFYEEWDGLK